MQCMVCGCSKKTEKCITYTVHNESFETEIEVESYLMIIHNSGLTSVKYNLTNGDTIRVANNQLTWWHTDNTIECFNNCEVYLNDTK